MIRAHCTRRVLDHKTTLYHTYLILLLSQMETSLLLDYLNEGTLKSTSGRQTLHYMLTQIYMLLNNMWPS